MPHVLRTETHGHGQNSGGSKLYRYSSGAEGPNGTLHKMTSWGEAVESRSNADYERIYGGKNKGGGGSDDDDDDDDDGLEFDADGEPLPTNIFAGVLGSKGGLPGGMPGMPTMEGMAGTGLLQSGGLDAELYNFTPKTQEEYNKLASGMSMGMELPISPPRFVFGLGAMGAPPPMPTSEGSGKNKRGLSVVIPGNGKQHLDSLGSGRISKMSPPPSFGLGEGSVNAFLTSPSGQAFPSPTAFLSELQTPTHTEGALDGMTPGALAQFSWNSPQGAKSSMGSGGGFLGRVGLDSVLGSSLGNDLSSPDPKRLKTHE